MTKQKISEEAEIRIWLWVTMVTSLLLGVLITDPNNLTYTWLSMLGIAFIHIIISSRVSKIFNKKGD